MNSLQKNSGKQQGCRQNAAALHILDISGHPLKGGMHDDGTGIRKTGAVHGTEITHVEGLS
jgi:hypothetical protein